jgi:hypothetical protein
VLLQVLEKVEKSMPKGTSKVIADAGRHRRTPWTLAVESKTIERHEIGRHRRHWRRTKMKKHAKTIKQSPKWQPKSI